MWNHMPQSPPPITASSGVEPEWLALAHRRCREYGLSPDRCRVTTDAGTVGRSALQGPATRSIALARARFGDIQPYLADTRTLCVFTDAEARVLDTYSATAIDGWAVERGLVIGASLREELAGTNAVALALERRAPAVTRGAEHYCRVFQDCTVAAAPVIDRSGKRSGALALISASLAAGQDWVAVLRLLAEHLARDIAGDGSWTADGGLPSMEAHKPRGLSPRQWRVVSLLTQGMTYKEIAAVLEISPRTVESHVEKLRASFGARTTPQLVAMLAERMARPPDTSVSPLPDKR